MVAFGKPRDNWGVLIFYFFAGGFILLERAVVLMFLIGMIAFGAGAATSQDYPNKPIRIVTAEVGGGADFQARVIAQGLSERLGQQVIVDARPSGVIPGEIVAKASPDGYTLLLNGSTFWIGPLLREATPYDVVRDFSSISLTTKSPNVLVLHPSLPSKSVKELIALAKARPGELNYASSAPGTASYLAAGLFRAMAGVNIVGVPYKGTAPALNGLIGGHVQLMFAGVAAVMPHVKSGRLRALAVTSARPSALAPGLPTLAASGLLNYEAVAQYGVFAPVKTPAALVNRLNQEIVQVLNRAEVREKFFNAGVEVVGSSPEQLAATVISEIARMGKVIKEAGIRVE